MIRIGRRRHPSAQADKHCHLQGSSIIRLAYQGGNIYTIAGTVPTGSTANTGYTGDGGSAFSARLYYPRSIVTYADTSGASYLFFSDMVGIVGHRLGGGDSEDSTLGRLANWDPHPTPPSSPTHTHTMARTPPTRRETTSCAASTWRQALGSQSLPWPAQARATAVTAARRQPRV